jgi:hypothetical protein
MPAQPDDAARLNGSRLCEIAGVIRQTRDKWASQGLLRAADGYEEIDVIEVVILNALLTSLKKGHAKVAWVQVRPKLRDVMPGPGLAVVWDHQRRNAELVLDDSTIGSSVRHGRPVQVVDVGSAVLHAREAFRRDLQRSSATRPVRTRARKRRSGRL